MKSRQGRVWFARECVIRARFFYSREAMRGVDMLAQLFCDCREAFDFRSIFDALQESFVRVGKEGESMLQMQEIGIIHTDFETKFGVPRQSGVVPELKGKIVMLPAYRDPEAFRGLQEFSHLWLLWGFSASARKWSPTVRPPRLGGNARMGVFATRAPVRPNPIGLSCVKLDRIAQEAARGTVLYVSGIDMMDGTPVYDIKPYLPYADCRQDAAGGFTERLAQQTCEVYFAENVQEKLPKEVRRTLCRVLAQDPRPRYQEDAERIYGMGFAGYEVKFRVIDDCVEVIAAELQQ